MQLILQMCSIFMVLASYEIMLPPDLQYNDGDNCNTSIYCQVTMSEITLLLLFLAGTHF